MIVITLIIDIYYDTCSKFSKNVSCDYYLCVIYLLEGFHICMAISDFYVNKMICTIV